MLRHRRTSEVAGSVRSRDWSREGRVRKEVRTFATTTAALGELASWLQTCGVTHAAMESTGVFWKPVWHVLEPHVALLLVNPRDVAKVPGRKTDVSDAEWIAQLLQCGLLRGSFVPPRPIRELRDLTRSRTTLEQQRAAVVNRIHKVLEDANVKLGTVVTDITGVSGRAILQALIDGQTRSDGARRAGEGALAQQTGAPARGRDRSRDRPSPVSVAPADE